MLTSEVMEVGLYTIDKSKPVDSIARVIRRTRERRGIPQRELAARTGKTRTTLSRMESGKHDLRISTIVELLDELGMELIAVDRDTAAMLRDMFELDKERDAG